MATIDIIKWLESPAGEAWSRSQNRLIAGILVSVKEDAPEEFAGWGVSTDNEDEPAFLWYIPDDATL